MSHQANHHRGAPSDPRVQKPTTDLTGKRHQKPTTTTTSAVYNLTNHFSRLHTNPKATKSQNPLPKNHLIDTHLQAKALSKSVNLDPPQKFGFGKQGKRAVLENDKNNKNPLVISPPSVGARVKKVERESGKEERKDGVAKPTTTSTNVVKVGGGIISRRRSFCDVQAELANFLVTNSAKLVSADMPPFLQIHAVGFARKIKDSLEKFTSKSLALSLKKEFDGAYGPAWHCIVGTSFGSFVTHSVGGFLYFSLDQKLYVLLFKTTVQRAD